MRTPLVLLASFTMLLAVPCRPVHAQPVGVFDGHADVGGARHAGAATYDPATDAYTVVPAGPAEDAAHVVWKRMTGDFILLARVEAVGGAGFRGPTGWTVRRGLGPDDAAVDAVLHGDGRASLRYRPAAHEEAETIPAAVVGADVVQVAREDGVFTMSVARFGEPFERVALADADLPDEVLVGLFAAGPGAHAAAPVHFRDVRIVVPAGPDLVPYRDYLGSRLEILDVETGARRVVHTTPGSIQAPNWTPDGRALIYNGDGLLYRFDLDTGTPTVIDTDFAVRNNNDHVISFDGRTLAISHHAEEHDGASIIYTVPIEGGVPRKVTDRGPSYLHGWSADDRHLVYTALRDGDYDVYRIPVEGGVEERLTDAPGLDDGPEYTPDGAWIYFNSSRTGSMEIWRMRPDGTGQEQLTDDSFNNWFPHIAPDGRSVLFLSYGDDVDPDAHPFYKHVYLRHMPLDGGMPRVVAYLYGGQGTINVPSWSPDGRYAAFVSNTQDP